MSAVENFQGLLQRARDGDAKAAGCLLERHLPNLRAYVRLKSGPALRERESHSDLVQSVCREFLQEADRLECVDESAFRAWLLRVAWHKILGRVRHHRAQKRDVAREEHQPPAGEESLLSAYGNFCTPSRDVVAREEVARIESAFDQLSEPQRDVILEVCMHGRPHKDVAAEMGKSEEALRQLLSRARARLALALAEST